MKNVALISWLLVFGLFAAAYGSWHLWKVYHEDDFGSGGYGWSDHGSTSYKTGLMQTPGGELADFTLVDSTGQPFHLHDSAGKVRAISFFFISCPAICFQLNNTLAKLQTDMDGKEIQFLSITCDPKNDTPSQLANYATRFGADPNRWKFLTGEMPTLEEIGRSLMVTVAPSTHSDRVILLDRQGRVRGNFRATEADQMAQLKTAIAKLIAEPYVPPKETAAGGATPDAVAAPLATPATTPTEQPAATATEAGVK